ncbi:MAG TPA: CoA-binding protein [Candidatus Polarisedimenticolia bacterium]|nr:CoA-binding protein [Candidatus Polarisedimenticolia bacterium]
MTPLEILDHYKVWAVVGLSDRPERPSHSVASALKRRGYRVVPVNPNLTRVLEETCYPDLRAIPFPIDVVDIFRRSELVGPIVDDAIAIGAKVVWMQLGVIDDAAAARARAAGLLVVMDRCPAIELGRASSRGGRDWPEV